MSTTELFEDLGRFAEALSYAAEKYGVEKSDEPVKTWREQGAEEGRIGGDSRTPLEVVGAGIEAIEEWQAGYWGAYYR